MRAPESDEEVLAAVRALPPGVPTGMPLPPATVSMTQGYLMLQFSWGAGESLVTVRVQVQRSGSGFVSPWTGLTVDDATQWADHLVWMLREEIEAGAILDAWQRAADGTRLQLDY